MTTTPPLLSAPTAADTSGPREGPTTASTRKSAVLVGLLFLTATAAFIVADMLNAGVLVRPGFLTTASTQTTALGTGALLLFGQFGVVGIAVLLYPVVKRHGQPLALAHIGFRVAELAASLFYLAVPLLAIDLGARLQAGTLDPAVAGGLEALLHAHHHVAILLIYLVTSAAGMCMAILLYRSRVIPRWIAILGLVSYPALLIGSALDIYGLADITQGAGLAALIPGALFELILPIRLIARGFTITHPDEPARR
jgi:hypothetical protein